MQLEADSVLSRAESLLARGDTPAAVELLESARAHHSRHAGIALRLADALQACGRLREAVTAYTEALGLDAASAESWYGSGCAHLSLRAFGAAAGAFARACELAPHAGIVHFNRAASLFELGHIEDAIEHYRRAARLEPELARRALASIACIIPGSSEADHETVLESRRSWAALEMHGVASCRSNPPPQPAARSAWPRMLRVGYLSAFFGDRNWMKPVFALINRHDRAAFAVHLFSDGSLPCAASGYCDHDSDTIHDMRGADNDRAADHIRAQAIDVLVDLNAYSFQRRLPMLLQRPAARIVGWFNSFATSGFSACDWIVGDPAVVRESEERYYCERVHRVAGTYLAFEFRYPVPEVAPPPCIAQGGEVTFGYLGSHYKLTDAVLGAWARILRAAPRARLLVKTASLDEPSTREELLERLSSRGVERARVRTEGRSEHYEFLEAYRHVDIALDTFPYNGGTTTTEALWQGVPVLAFDGDRWASRTSKSLLLAAGLEDWVLPDLERYEERAAALACDPATPTMLARLRAGMRARLKASPACDAEGLCRAMEAFYVSIAR
ncbi:MAG TPA: tetratricopeptide repeat protein [Steroidobacteraceae bacterium]|nr:tetratricopeptide repeat protein [Steroidobacteraceae bacterium]